MKLSVSRNMDWGPLPSSEEGWMVMPRAAWWITPIRHVTSIFFGGFFAFAVIYSFIWSSGENITFTYNIYSFFVISIATILLHELLHISAVISRDVLNYLLVFTNGFYLFLLVSKKMSRNRFLLMAFMPFLLLTIIPALLARIIGINSGDFWIVISVNSLLSGFDLFQCVYFGIVLGSQHELLTVMRKGKPITYFRQKNHRQTING